MKMAGLEGGWHRAKINAPLTGLVFRPDNGSVPRVPAQLLKDAENDALGDGLFVGEPALSQAGDDVGECGFEGHKLLSGRA